MAKRLVALSALIMGVAAFLCLTPDVHAQTTQILFQVFNSDRTFRTRLLKTHLRLRAQIQSSARALASFPAID